MKVEILKASEGKEEHTFFTLLTEDERGFTVKIAVAAEIISYHGKPVYTGDYVALIQNHEGTFNCRITKKTGVWDSDVGLVALTEEIFLAIISTIEPNYKRQVLHN